MHYNCNSYYSWKYCNTKLYSEINWNIIRRIRRIKKDVIEAEENGEEEVNENIKIKKKK